ncbi:MAG: hypothetical protein KAG97_03785, partial [Victivallales bacterium]|nr:hypothetical protein [Victivallales bacterium]
KKELDEAYRKLNDSVRHPDVDAKVIRQTLWTQALFVSKRVYANLFEWKIISESVFRELVAHNAISVDLVSHGELPKSTVFPVPLEKRILEFATRIFRKIIPDASFTKKLHMANFKTQYEIVAASVISSHQTRKLIQKLKKIHNVHLTVFDECDQRFSKRSADAMERLKSMSKEFPELFDKLQEDSITRFAHTAEMKAVNNLVEHGAIPEALGVSLIDEM